MKNRVGITRAKYIVNPEKKVVVCVLECNMQLCKHPAYMDIYPYMWNNLPFVDGNGTFKVRAIARCNEEDAFNEEAGKRIAESRAKGKAFATAAKEYIVIKRGSDGKTNINISGNVNIISENGGEIHIGSTNSYVNLEGHVKLNGVDIQTVNNN